MQISEVQNNKILGSLKKKKRGHENYDIVLATQEATPGKFLQYLFNLQLIGQLHGHL
jgi:hypothetical protein